MLHIPITDLDLPELQPYRTLRRQEEHYRQRIFVVEGEKTLRRLLATELVVVSVLLTQEWLRIFDPLLSQRRAFNPADYAAPKRRPRQGSPFSR